jgi:hypothetical protein
MQTVRAEALIEEVNPVDEGGYGDGSAPGYTLHPSSFSSTRAAAENANYADSFRGNAGGMHKAGKLPKYAKVEPVGTGIETPERRLYVNCEGGHQWAYKEGKEYQGEIQAFVVKVELPRMDNANDADVDVAEDSLSLQVLGKYELEMELPYKVGDNDADCPRQLVCNWDIFMGNYFLPNNNICAFRWMTMLPTPPGTARSECSRSRCRSRAGRRRPTQKLVRRFLRNFHKKKNNDFLCK